MYLTDALKGVGYYKFDWEVLTMIIIWCGLALALTALLTQLAVNLWHNKEQENEN